MELVIIALVAGFIIYKVFIKIKPEKDNRKVNSYSYNQRVSYVKSKPSKGKRRSKQEIEHDNIQHAKRLAERSREYAKVERIKQERIGVKKYTWLSCQDERTCPECAKNNGKTFFWNKPPDTGHPGEGKCCPNGHCRCVPIAKL